MKTNTPNPSPEQFPSPPHEDLQAFPPMLLPVFLVLALVIVAAGVSYYRKDKQNFRSTAESQISAIADLKVAELVQWRRERMIDGAQFHDNPAFSVLVRRYFENPEDAEARRQLQAWLGNIHADGQYGRVRLLDAQGKDRLGIGDGQVPTDRQILQRLPDVLRENNDTVLLDFFRSDHDQRIYLAAITSVFDETADNRPLGAVVLLIDPANYLYPFIKRWPTPSRTAETLLVCRDGNEVLFLNDLRFQTNAVLNLRYPLDRVELPAAQAALGHEGVMDGVDYRGEAVLAATRTIPGSTWALVARMDAEEIFASQRDRLWQVLVMSSALMLALAGAAGLFWRRLHLQMYREKAEAGEKVRESEIRYRRLFETTRDGILILDADTGVVLDVNPFMVELLGCPREAFLAKKVWELDFFKDVLASQENFAELRNKGHIRYEDLSLETNDGRRIDVEFIGTVYGVEHGKVVQCNIRDISERKRAERDLQEKNAELERFLYTASHDLKSPVVTVRTFLGYLEQDIAANDAARIEKDTRYIRNAADKMARLLDELLDLSRVGRVTTPPVRMTLRSLAEEALSAVAGAISERGVTVTVDDHDILLHGDRPRLVEIWQNLVENACKFMGDQQAPRLEIGGEVHRAETVFFVRDNGCGIDPRYHAKVFGLFEKLDPKAEGTGLGLAMVKRIVELYRGRIWIESAGQGQGSCFYFTLPGAETKGDKS